MTEIRIRGRAGWTLVYDTDDVETTNLGVMMPSGPETIDSRGTVRREPSGFMSFDLHVSFKHGKKAQWVRDAAAEKEPTS